MDNRNKKIKYIIYGLVIILVALVGLIAYDFFFAKPKDVTRTFMIYMAGSDLESNGAMATSDLDGIDPEEVDFDNVNVVVIAGGAKEWHNDYIDGDSTSIYQLTEDGFVKVREQELLNMGESETLEDFLNYTSNTYITDEYELIFWNHGGALQGSEYDELFMNDNLELVEIKEALENTDFKGNNKIETIIFSTCLNGTVENATVFSDHADYFVASEEVSLAVRGRSDLSFINDVTLETESVDIGLMYIEKYKSKMQFLKENYESYNMEYDIYSTYSVLDLNNVDNLNNEIEEFFGSIDIEDNYNEIAKIRSNLYQYAYESASIPSYDMVDLYNLVLELKHLSPQKADKLIEELENTIIYNYSTNDSSRGVSIYFPYYATESIEKYYFDTYSKVSNNEKYVEFINDFSDLKTINASNKLSFEKNSSSTEFNEETNTTDFTLNLTEEQVKAYAKSEYIVFRDNKDGTYYPVYKGKEATLENNQLTAKITDRQLGLYSTSDEVDFTITLIEKEVSEKYITYDSVVILQDFRDENFIMKAATMSLTLDRESNNVDITNTVINSTYDLPNRTTADINDYQSIAFGSSSYYILDDEGNVDINWSDSSNGVFTGYEEYVENLNFKIYDFDDGYDYYCTFEIDDVNNNTYYSELIKLNKEEN